MKTFIVVLLLAAIYLPYATRVDRASSLTRLAELEHQLDDPMSLESLYLEERWAR